MKSAWLPLLFILLIVSFGASAFLMYTSLKENNHSNAEQTLTAERVQEWIQTREKRLSDLERKIKLAKGELLKFEERRGEEVEALHQLRGELDRVLRTSEAESAQKEQPTTETVVSTPPLDLGQLPATRSIIGNGLLFSADDLIEDGKLSPKKAEGFVQALTKWSGKPLQSTLYIANYQKLSADEIRSLRRTLEAGGLKLLKLHTPPREAPPDKPTLVLAYASRP